MILKQKKLYKDLTTLVSSSEDEYYFIDEKKQLVINGTIRTEIEFEPTKLISQGNLLLIFDSYQQVHFYDKTTGKFGNWKLSDNEKFIHNQNFLSNDLIFQKEISLLESKFGYYNTKTGYKEIHDNFYPKFVQESLIIGNDKTSIYRYSQSEKKWVFNLSSFGKYTNQWNEERSYEVKKFIGVWKDELIVLLSGGKFIGLDIESGELKWNLSEVKNNLTQQDINFGFSDPNNPFLDDKSGHVYMLQGEVLIDLDLTKLEASYMWSVKDLELESYPFIRQSKMYGDKIYFTARSHVNKDDDMVGVFDLKKNRIIWQHIFSFERGTFITNSPDNILVNGKNVMILDNQSRLYIIELQ